jgi:acyl carrier protein
MSLTFESYLQTLQKEVDVLVGVSPDAPLSGLPQWDSLAILLVISHFEQTYKMSVTGREIRQCKTIRELIQLIPQS